MSQHNEPPMARVRRVAKQQQLVSMNTYDAAGKMGGRPIARICLVFTGESINLSYREFCALRDVKFRLLPMPDES